MARLLVGADTDYLQYVGAPVAVSPLSFALWLKPTTQGNNRIPMALNQANGAATYALEVDMNGRVYAENGTAFAQTSAGVIVNDTWAHLCAVFDGSGTTVSTRAVYVDGTANKGTNSTGDTAASIAVTTIGAWLINASVANFIDGAVAYAGLWNIALSDADVDLLAVSKYAPWLVQSGNLVAAWAIAGDLDPEPDYVGGADMGVFGSPAPAKVAAPPGIITSLGNYGIGRAR